jgi:hypothetical protein
MAVATNKRKKDLQYERDAAQARVNEYFRKNPMTGNPFQDVGGLLATREDRRAVNRAEAAMEEELNRGVTMRGQDFQRELGLGEIDVNKEKNRLTGRGQDFEKEIEMRKADVTAQGYQQHHDVGMGELQLNRDIFNRTKERYDKYGEPLDQLGVARAAAGTQATFDDLGYEMPTVLEEFRPKYIGGESVARPEPYVDENSIYYNKPYAPKPSPIAAAVSDIGTMLTTGPSDVALPYAGMSIGKKAGEGLINLFRPKPRNKVRGKVRRVN